MRNDTTIQKVRLWVYTVSKETQDIQTQLGNDGLMLLYVLPGIYYNNRE